MGKCQLPGTGASPSVVPGGEGDVRLAEKTPRERTVVLPNMFPPQVWGKEGVGREGAAPLLCTAQLCGSHPKSHMRGDAGGGTSQPRPSLLFHHEIVS